MFQSFFIFSDNNYFINNVKKCLLGFIYWLILICGPKFTKKLIAPLTIIFTPIILSIGIVKNDFLINLSRKIVPSII